MGATVENISISFVLPNANCDLKLTTTEQGLVSSIAFLGIVVSSHFWVNIYFLVIFVEVNTNKYQIIVIIF